MQTGFEVVARPKRARDYEEEDRAHQVPMRPERRGEQRRNPSADQKKVRHQQQRRTAEANPGPGQCECEHHEHFEEIPGQPGTSHPYGKQKADGRWDVEGFGPANLCSECRNQHWHTFIKRPLGSPKTSELLLSRRIAAVSYATTIDDVLRSTDG